MQTISESELNRGFDELSQLRESEYGDGLDWSLQRSYFDDEELWRICRLAGILMKVDFATRREIDPAQRANTAITKTGARFSYVMSQDRLGTPDFTKSWQFQIYEAMRHGGVVLDRGSAADNALWLDGERKTITYVMRMIYPFVCSEKGSEAVQLVDDLMSEGVKLTVQTAPSLALASWLVANVPLLAPAPPAFIAAVVVILGRMGHRRFCTWGKWLHENDDAGRPGEA